MNTTEFNERASATLGGRGWMTRLAEITGVHYATVKRWSNGSLPVPLYAIAIVELLEIVPEAFRPARFLKTPRQSRAQAA